MLKKATIEDIIQYLKKFYLSNRNEVQESKEWKSYYQVINKFYDEFIKEYSFDIEKKTNPYFYDYYEKEYDESNDTPIYPIVRIAREEIYTSDINEYKIKQLYPKTISLCYHNTEFFNEYVYYVYLIDNFKEINKKLDKKEQFMFKNIINHQYSMIAKDNPSQQTYLMEGYRKMVDNLFEKDFYSDIIFFNTVSIFTTNTIEVDKLINTHLKKFYDIEIKHHNYGFFVRKKKYFLFDTKPKVKGYDRKSNFYSDKQVKNTAYNLSKYDGPFRNFNSKTASDFYECKTKARKLNPEKDTKEPELRLYNVVFLPTKKHTNTSSMVIQECIESILSNVKVGQLMYTPRILHSDEYFRETDIYITSDDEEIKLGDWIIQTNYEKTFNELVKIETDFQLKVIKEKGSFTYRKIIATTNSYLNLPKLKKDFISKFIKHFNKNILIDKVYVEMIQLSVKGNYQNKCVECGKLFNNSDRFNFICEKCGLKVKLNYNNEINIIKIDNYINNDLWKKLN